MRACLLKIVMSGHIQNVEIQSRALFAMSGVRMVTINVAHDDGNGTHDWQRGCFGFGGRRCASE
jgi:hypothetical protein